MIGLSMVGLLAGCGFALPEEPKCDEPHLYYAPAPASDVYFGCEPPLGWLSTPPDEARFDPPAVAEAEVEGVAPSLSVDEAEADDPPADPLSQVEHDTASVVWAGTGDTGDTALAEDRPDPGPADTAEPPSDDTGAEPRDEDTRDTAAPRDDTAEDTGAPPPEGDTGAEPPPGDTGAPPPPPVDTGAPPPPPVDTGSR
ncbi:MAG: hypothetical protein ABMA64_41355 [Myxococcota bacterium]